MKSAKLVSPGYAGLRRDKSAGFQQAGTNAPVRRQFHTFGPQSPFQRGGGRASHKTLFPLEPADRVGRDLRFVGQILNLDRQVRPCRAKLCRCHILCLKTNFDPCNHIRLPYISVQTQMWLQPQKRSRANKMRFIKMHFGPNPQKGKAIMKTTLSTNTLHFSAAQAYRRARNSVIHAKLSPWYAERELSAARYWRESAAYWRSQAALDAQPVTLPPVRTWAVSVSWEDEISLLLTSPAAASADVE